MSRMCYEVNLRLGVFMPYDLLRHSLIYPISHMQLSNP